MFFFFYYFSDNFFEGQITVFISKAYSDSLERCFCRRLISDLLLSWAFTAVGRYVFNQLKVNYSAWVHFNEEPPV